MTSETRAGGSLPAQSMIRPALALRFILSSGPWSIPLHELHHLAGYATLAGEQEDYFLGWLALRGEQVPVFDLNLVVCDQPTPERFGSRILVLKAAPECPTPYIGLLAAGVTDTLSADAESANTLDLGDYLPMLYTLIPAEPPPNR